MLKFVLASFVIASLSIGQEKAPSRKKKDPKAFINMGQHSKHAMKRSKGDTNTLSKIVQAKDALQTVKKEIIAGTPELKAIQAEIDELDQRRKALDKKLDALVKKDERYVATNAEVKKLEDARRAVQMERKKQFLESMKARQMDNLRKRAETKGISLDELIKSDPVLKSYLEREKALLKKESDKK